MTEKNILFVDDEVNNLKAFRRLFRGEKCAIHTVESAEQGLVLLERESIDVVVSDNKMPGMSGLEFSRILKEKYPDMPRIMLTGYNELARIKEENVVSLILTKPWDGDTLKQVILEYLNTEESHAPYTE